eukprot:c27344_g1_i2 orf=370-2505(-)
MARNKEILVLLLDISPSIRPHLQYVAKAASTIIQRKIHFSKSDEVGLVLFGAKETSNDLHEELGGYDHVFVSRPIKVVDTDLLDSLNKLVYGAVPGDYVDAIVVGMDMIIKKAGAGKKGNKRLCLITDGESLVKDAEDGSTEEQIDNIAGQLGEHGMKLDAVLVDIRPFGAHKTKIHAMNEALLKRFAKHSQVELTTVESPTSLLGAIKPRNVIPVTLYRGDLELTPHMNVKVWVYKKVARETFPTLKRYSDKAPPNDPNAIREVKTDIEYRSTDDPDKVVPPEQRSRGYNYGPQLVPISNADQDALKFKAEKGLKLIGMTDSSNVLRHHYMKEANVFIPEPGNTKSIIAISALARAMKETDKVAIVRCVWRQGQTGVTIGVLTPHVSAEDNLPDYFYFNILPFAEDVREFPFTSFDSFPPSMQPSESQQAVADNLVKMLDLAPPGKEETLIPERTLNPVLQRWFDFLQARLGNPNVDVPPLDDALRKIIEPDPLMVAENEFVTKQFHDHFLLEVNMEKDKRSRGFWREKEPDDVGRVEEEDIMELDNGQISFDSLTARKVDVVGRLHPVQDFEAMLARRDSDEWVMKAIQEMKKIIVDLLDMSYKGNTYDRVMACLISLRKGCVEQQEPAEFNNFLHELAGKCYGKRLNDFWERIVEKQLTLINKNEAPDSDVLAEEALTFLSGMKPSVHVIASAEDEIDEMEALLGEAI